MEPNSEFWMTTFCDIKVFLANVNFK